MKGVDCTFSINDYDRDGDILEEGIFLRFGPTRIKVADSLEEFRMIINVRSRSSKKKDLWAWHKWFAWRPVLDSARTNDGDGNYLFYIWLRVVRRKQIDVIRRRHPEGFISEEPIFEYSGTDPYCLY